MLKNGTINSSISAAVPKGHSEDRNKILNALSLGEGAAIAALIPVLTGLGLAPALAAVLPQSL